MSDTTTGLPAPHTPGVTSVTDTTRSGPIGGGFRPEIEGLRAVAVLLVAVYHIWFGRVSGGVDVFLLLTGFLITGSLVRAVERDGRVRFGAFWARLARRLVPPVAVVLVATMVAMYVWLPRSRWADLLAEIRAAALYHENWTLAHNAVDYLAREAAASPLQHFWSLSIQGQFYLLWPLLVTAGAVLASRVRWPLRRAVLVLSTVVFAVSLAYSVHITDRDQAWAYFDTGARLWELALGAILALVITELRLPARLRVFLGWFGLVALVSCGVLLQVSTLFPGYVALWPTGAALLVIVAGATGSRYGVDRLLTWSPLMAVGRLSYGLYLWHWPLLVCYLEVTGRSTATVAGGLVILVGSFALAWITHRVVEGGVERFTRPAVRRTPGWSVTVAAVFLVPVLAVTHVWSERLEEERDRRVQELAAPESYPGARVVADPDLLSVLPRVPVRPDPADAQRDLSSHHEEGCHVNLGSEELVVCDRGPADAEHTLALVGASRTAHWYPAVERVAAEHGWRLVSFTKSGCPFALAPATRDGGPFPECEVWKDKALAELEELNPDAVLLSSTRAFTHEEVIQEGYTELWWHLNDLGIDVIGLRDLPRLPYRGAECLEATDAAECTSPASLSQQEVDPATLVEDVPPNVTLLDLTEHVCPAGDCDAVVGNVLVYWDHSHITATYADTLTPVVEDALVEATGW
ncbi:acyltransferase family protein [Nocardiopsis sp. MG754419]|uniref:acyltransferase family protein n=1 Tax=Nocardiopsis sp. MG754419 TaxID=2259865 RepID=UPI001BA4DE9A|nr:acyltransferase family protein [Nocardiopsis sp. MG754419]MBR8740682.1 acyltransferase [Nocardiopsis sp. MG754419]